MSVIIGTQAAPWDATVTARWVCGSGWACESFVASVSIREAGQSGNVFVTLNGIEQKNSATGNILSSGSGGFCDIDPPG